MDRPRGQYIEGSRDPMPANDYDVAVIGAGVYGLMVAYFVRQLIDGARVIVLEDNTIPGEGITVNTGGIIRACYSNIDVMIAAAFGRPYFAEPTKTMKLSTVVETGFVPATWGRFANERETPGIREEFQRIVEAARELGLPGIWRSDFDAYAARLAPGRRANLAKIFDTADVTDVLADDHGGYADGGTTLLALLEAALEHGADVARLCHVTGFVREGGAIRGVRYRRWRSRLEGERTVRETTGEGELRCSSVVVAAGAGSRRLLERECSVRMPTFPTFHQTPMIENTPATDFATTRYARAETTAGGDSPKRELVTVDLPVISHWRDFYFHSEGTGVTLGAHHRELHDEDYVPTGGRIELGDTALEVGLSQVLVDKIIENMEHFPPFSGDSLRLGKRPSDVPGGFYVMNPEELPFEGAVPDNDGLYYIGSGSGTGFKLGPGLAYLLVQRMAGVPRDQRLVRGGTLSVERNRYFYPADMSDTELRALFDPASGRFRHVGASGVAVQQNDSH